MSRETGFSGPKFLAGRGAPMGALAVSRLKQSAFVGGVAGLELRITARGVKSWRLYYRLPGEERRFVMTLGRYPGVSLDKARAEAHKALARSQEGEDPKALRAENVRAGLLLLDQALDDYLMYCSRENSASTASDKRRALRNHVRPTLGKRPLARIKRSEWLALFDKPGLAHSMRRSLYMYVRHFLVWALERGHIENHPLYGMRPPKRGPSRDRVLTDAEIRALWEVEGETPDMARLALLTAQRQGSIARMQWGELDLDQALWSIPAENMKSGKPHVVPLMPMALDILRQRAACRLEGPYVFGVNSNGARPYDGFSNGMEGLRLRLAGEDTQQGRRLSVRFKKERRERLREALGTTWRFHDLRRTAVTLAQRRGAAIDAIKALTQHKTAGVIGIYARHAFTHEKAEVARLIEAELVSILSAVETPATDAPSTEGAARKAKTAMPPAPKGLIKLPVVTRQTGLRRYSIYAAIAKGTFPAPVRVGARGVAWPQEAVEAWMAKNSKRSVPRRLGRAGNAAVN